MSCNVGPRSCGYVPFKMLYAYARTSVRALNQPAMFYHPCMANSLTLSLRSYVYSDSLALHTPIGLLWTTWKAVGSRFEEAVLDSLTVDLALQLQLVQIQYFTMVT